MEIERKFLVKNPLEDYADYTHHEIAQGYLSVSPVIRIRRCDDRYILTVKGDGHISREEFELPLTREQFENLSDKVSGNLISKTRYLIPAVDGLTIELDIFHGRFEGLIYAEIEFPSLEAAESYTPEPYMVRDVTSEDGFSNAELSAMPAVLIPEFISGLF